MPIADDQQQVAVAPDGNPAMLAGNWLQLAFEQLLQLRNALRFIEQRLQWSGLA